MVGRFGTLLGLCIALGMALHFVMALNRADDGSGFYLEQELELLSADERVAAREKWNSLSESQKNQARGASRYLSPEAKRKVLEKLKAKNE